MEQLPKKQKAARLPATHGRICLPLLPSGPGGVHRLPLHRAQLPTYIQIFMAERVGFEPTVRLLSAHTISSRAPSATRAPLRNNVITYLALGGEGGIRTHVPRSSRDKAISSRPRYGLFGTSPLFKKTLD